MKQPMPRRFLVAGARDALGRRVVELLLRRDDVEVIATSRQPSDLVDLAARGARIRSADPDDATSLDVAFSGAQRMLLVPGATDGLWARRRQLEAMVDAAERAGVRSIVYAPSVDAFDPTLVVLERECSVMARVCEARSIPLSILRVGWHIERLFSRITLALRCGKWLSSAPQGHLPYIASEDVARTVAAVLSWEGPNVDQLDITGPMASTPEALVRSINAIFGSAVELVSVTDDALAVHLQESGFTTPAVREVLVMEEMAKREPSLLPGNAVQQITGRLPRGIEAVLVENRLDLLLSSRAPRV